MGKRISFTINGAKYPAVLHDDVLTEQIAAMCPFEAEFSRSGSHEYYAVLPKKLSVKGCASTTEGCKNGIYYFEGWNAVSLVIKDCNTAPYPIFYLGDFENDVSAMLSSAGEHIRILCEAE